VKLITAFLVVLLLVLYAAIVLDVDRKGFRSIHSTTQSNNMPTRDFVAHCQCGHYLSAYFEQPAGIVLP
jgi:hypothetical protein